MLQQTQVGTVIPYFKRWMERFPTPQSLAAASLDEVLALWQGLGYYRRARNLHASAQIIVSKFGGEVPSGIEELMSLPGVGRYTAGAVASIAYNRQVPIVDGNVARVLCRWLNHEGAVSDRATQKFLWDEATCWAEATDEPGSLNSAIMELGATVCTPQKPACRECPLNSTCQAFKAKTVDRIPPAAKAAVRPNEYRLVLVVSHQNQFLLEKRPQEGRWAGMWQFLTVIDAQPKEPCTFDLPGELEPVFLTQFTHDLTHRKYHYRVFSVELKGKVKPDSLAPFASSFSEKHNNHCQQCWHDKTRLDDVALPRPHQKILEQMLAKNESSLF